MANDFLAVCGVTHARTCASLGDMGRILLAVILLFVGLRVCAQTPSNSLIRVERAQATLSNLEAMAKDVTNETERVIWDRRVELAKKEITNAQRLAEIEAREREVEISRQSGKDTGEALRSLLRMIEPDPATLASATVDLDKKMRKARDIRAEKTAEAAGAAKGEDAAQRKADIEQALRTIDVEIAAIRLQRDGLDLQARLASEAHHIESCARKRWLRHQPSGSFWRNGARSGGSQGCGGVRAARATVAGPARWRGRNATHRTGTLQSSGRGDCDAFGILYRSVKASMFSFKKTEHGAARAAATRAGHADGWMRAAKRAR